jgi:hypothetical protein
MGFIFEGIPTEHTHSIPAFLSFISASALTPAAVFQ